MHILFKDDEFHADFIVPVTKHRLRKMMREPKSKPEGYNFWRKREFTPRIWGGVRCNV